MNFPSDQKLHPDVKIIMSTAKDGSMAAGVGNPSAPEHVQNVENFLRRHSFDSDRTRIYVTYGDKHRYTDVVRITSENAGSDVLCDAIYTTDAHRILTLPIGDCIAAVVYDPVVKLLGLLHLGRHASMAGLVESFVIEVADNAGSDPRDWLVWMSPSIRADNDRLEYFAPPNPEDWQEFAEEKNGKIHIDTIGYNRARLIRAGVRPKNIAVSPIDTYSDVRFFSHRAATEQSDASRQGRMIVAACVYSG